MHYLSDFENALYKSGLPFQGNKVIDDFLLTGNPNAVRDSYKCCQEAIATTMVGMLEMDDELSVLEPGAGKGCILKKIAHFTDHSYCEINIDFLVNHLAGISKFFECSNFFELRKKYDRIVMNPPFSHGAYAHHIIHAYNLLNPGGIVVFLYPKNALYLEIGNSNFLTFLEDTEAENTDVGKVCGECECVIGKIKKP